MIELSSLKSEISKFRLKWHPRTVWQSTRRTLGKLEQPRAGRGPASGLTAHFKFEFASAPAGIKDISATGIYLITEKRLSSGELVTLILKGENKPEDSSDLEMWVHARVARQGEDGIGLSFELPEGMDRELWALLLLNLISLTEPGQVADMFHTLRTILFLCRICQSEAEETILLLAGHLHPDRKASVAKISLGAETLLAAEPDADKMRANPKLVTNILRDGSWHSVEPTLRLWAGLLAASCSVKSSDDSNQIFVDLLVHVAPIQAKLFVLGCERTLAVIPEFANADENFMVVSPEEMIELTGKHDLYRGATDLAYLYNLGLIRRVFDFTSYHGAEDFDITPSDLGLELYRRCTGHRGKVDQHFVQLAEDHLKNFIPAVQPNPFDSKSSVPHYVP